MRTLRIAVVGCGVAGMALAVALARAGADVALLERFAEPRPLGAGFLLHPTGMAALQRLGCLEGIAARGARVDRLEGRNGKGRIVFDLSLGELTPGLHSLGVQRASLFAGLFRAVEAAPLTLRTDCDIVGLEDIEFAPTLIDARGRRHGPFDLVVAADGARSMLRRLLFGIEAERAYGWSALWALADDPEDRYGGALLQRYELARRMIGVLPVGRGGPEAGAVRRVVFFWSLPAAAHLDWRAAPMKRWRAEVLSLWPEIEDLVAQFTVHDQLAWATYFDVRAGLARRGRVLLIGDAAHGTSPQLGQGVNLALLDAEALARHLAVDRDFAGAFGAFERERRAHIRFYQIMSRALTPFFQSDREFLARLRDGLFAPLGAIGWFRRRMIETLCGIKTGPFGNLDPALFTVAEAGVGQVLDGSGLEEIGEGKA